MSTPTHTPRPVSSAATTTCTSMASALSVARRRREIGLMANRPIEPASISPARAFEAEAMATQMTAAGAIIEYISPFRKPAGVAMSAPPKKLVNSSGIMAIISPMLSCMGTNIGPSTRPMRPIRPPATMAVGRRSATALLKVPCSASRCQGRTWAERCAGHG